MRREGIIIAMSESRQKIPMGKFFAFDKIALVIGFIVDTITLTSILLSIRLTNGSFVLPHFITPWLALSLWVLGEYIYLALLHSYWQKNINTKNLQPSFSKFLTKDLIQNFHNPFLSFLGLVSLITLIWIASFDTTIAGLLTGLGFIVGLFWFIHIITTSSDVKVSEFQKKQIDTNWEFLKKLIKSKLAKKQWLSVSDLEDIALLWEANGDDMAFILAKYASENPNGFSFGEVYRSEDDVKVSGPYMALINIRNLDQSKYYYSG